MKRPGPLGPQSAARDSPGAKVKARRGLLVFWVAVPWSWFVVRDTLVIFEWVAILLPLLAAVAVVVLLVVALISRSVLPAVLAASTTVFAVVAIVAPWVPSTSPRPSPGLRLVAANVFGANQQPEALARDLLATMADVVVAAELTPPQQPVVAALDGHYPYRVGEEHDEVRVWSRFPLEGTAFTGELRGANGARVRVQAPDAPFLLYALHLQRPSRRALGPQLTVAEQARLVRDLTERMSAAELPVVVAGDLNLTDRGAPFRMIARNRRDAMRTGWTGPTSFRARNRPLLLRIDHVLIPGDWCAADADRFRLTGSDHAGLATTIGPCR